MENSPWCYCLRAGGGCFELTRMHWQLQSGTGSICLRPRGTEQGWGLWYSALASQPPLPWNSHHPLLGAGTAGTQLGEQRKWEMAEPG